MQCGHNQGDLNKLRYTHKYQWSYLTKECGISWQRLVYSFRSAKMSEDSEPCITHAKFCSIETLQSPGYMHPSLPVHHGALLKAELGLYMRHNVTHIPPILDKVDNVSQLVRNVAPTRKIRVVRGGPHPNLECNTFPIQKMNVIGSLDSDIPQREPVSIQPPPQVYDEIEVCSSCAQWQVHLLNISRD